jgi:hypothetical protein
MIRRAVLRWILLLIPAVATWAGLPQPGPPSTDGRDLGIAAALLAAGALGLLVLRMKRNAGEESPPPGVAARRRIMRVVCWLLVISGPAFLIIRTSIVSAERRKVLVTMSDMRRIATGWETRLTELQPPQSAGGGITFVERNAKAATVLPHTVTSEQMAKVLVPRYMDSFPMRDAWGNEWLLALDQPLEGSAVPAGGYAVASPGSDGRFGPPTDGNVPCVAWECDIVFANGQFVTQFPVGDDSHDYR